MHSDFSKHFPSPLLQFATLQLLQSNSVFRKQFFKTLLISKTTLILYHKHCSLQLLLSNSVVLPLSISQSPPASVVNFSFLNTAISNNLNLTLTLIFQYKYSTLLELFISSSVFKNSF